ncbi:MAG: RecX family transcriptional regulator [Bacillota bacterium]|nr:RecX family transcriptional regulator [Bacillota bacterium]
MKQKPSALSAALTYLSYQARTRLEMEQYLKKKEYTAAEIAQAIIRLKEYGYVDDAGFARRVAEMTHQHPAKGKNSLPQKLSRKGIPEELIQQTMEDYDESVDEEKAMLLARKHLMTTLDQPWKKCLDQINRRLFSRGFTSEVIRTVIRQLEGDETLAAAREDAEDDRYQQALALAIKTMNRWEAKEPLEYKLRQRILQSLFQKGFESDLAQRAAEEALQQRSSL